MPVSPVVDVNGRPGVCPKSRIVIVTPEPVWHDLLANGKCFLKDFPEIQKCLSLNANTGKIFVTFLQPRCHIAVISFIKCMREMYD